ncbi:unnamed protein product [Dovyalis caffra]|uniref:Uncharacterized protein n=1 Tax=Dovyalis caffra TaxID=77055 RepID=A0AAV1RBM6_9ROSI|nr:unnamed protein product [Dovyalis caffra]
MDRRLCGISSRTGYSVSMNLLILSKEAMNLSTTLSKQSITATQLTLVKNQEAKKMVALNGKQKGFICKQPSAIQEEGE